MECVVTNLIGAVLGWLAFLSFVFLYPDKRALYASTFIASFFTLLVSAHGVAYLIKRRKPNGLSHHSRLKASGIDP
jgi:hypothetical protein